MLKFTLPNCKFQPNSIFAQFAEFAISSKTKTSPSFLLTDFMGQVQAAQISGGTDDTDTVKSTAKYAGNALEARDYCCSAPMTAIRHPVAVSLVVQVCWAQVVVPY